MRSFSLVECIIILIFTIEGYAYAKSKKANFTKSLIISILFDFGGGFFLRDLVLLQGRNGVYIFKNPHYLLFSIFLVIVMKTVEIITGIVVDGNRKFINVCDAIGSVIWLKDGMRIAVKHNEILIVVILCGLATAFGGGIIAKTILGETNIFHYKRVYLLAFFAITYYIPMLYSTVSITIVAGCALSVFMLLMLLISQERHTMIHAIAVAKKIANCFDISSKIGLSTSMIECQRLKVVYGCNCTITKYLYSNSFKRGVSFYMKLPA